MSADDMEELRAARRILENPGVAAKLTNLLGPSIEKGFDLLPSDWRDRIGTATHDALMAALKTALATMGAGTGADRQAKVKANPLWHKAASALSGGFGGAFGLPALILELPVSTTIALRSIADIARSHGEDLSTADAQIACLEVFALGGPPVRDPGDGQSRFAYFAVRSALARAVIEASEYMAEKAVAEQGAPALVRLIAAIAARFQVQISEKAAATALPIVGAIGGASVNLLFIDHFQNMSHGHFTVRRLERKYGQAQVRKNYLSLT